MERDLEVRRMPSGMAGVFYVGARSPLFTADSAMELKALLERLERESLMLAIQTVSGVKHPPEDNAH